MRYKSKIGLDNIGMLYVGYEFRCEIGWNKMEVFIYLFVDVYLVEVFCLDKDIN